MFSGYRRTESHQSFVTFYRMILSRFTSAPVRRSPGLTAVKVSLGPSLDPQIKSIAGDRASRTTLESSLPFPGGEGASLPPLHPSLFIYYFFLKLTELT